MLWSRLALLFFVFESSISLVSRHQQEIEGAIPFPRQLCLRAWDLHLWEWGQGVIVVLVWVEGRGVVVIRLTDVVWVRTSRDSVQGVRVGLFRLFLDVGLSEYLVLFGFVLLYPLVCQAVPLMHHAPCHAPSHWYERPIPVSLRVRRSLIDALDHPQRWHLDVTC